MVVIERKKDKNGRAGNQKEWSLGASFVAVGGRVKPATLPETQATQLESVTTTLLVDMHLALQCQCFLGTLLCSNSGTF